MSLNSSSIRDLIIKLFSEHGIMRFHELKEMLEVLGIVVDAVELRTLIADMVREGLLHKEVGSGLRSPH